MITTLVDEMVSQLQGIAEVVVAEVREHGLLPLLQPVAPFDQPSFLTPAIALGGLLSLAMLSGAAVSAFGGLLLSLLALYLLLVEVFGFSFEIDPITIGR